MTNRTGVLPHSPLTHVIASVRFAPWPRLAKQIDDIQDSMRDIAPLMNAVQLEQVGPDGQAQGTPRQAWVLVASDHSFSIQYSQDQILLCTTNYGQFADFSSKFQRALSTLLEHMKFIDVLNMGVRYIDRIKAKDGEQISDYITSALLTPKIANHASIGSHIIAEYSKGDNVRLRVNAMSIPNTLTVPQDIIGALMMANVSNKALSFEVLKENEMVLDMDAIFTSTSPSRMPLEEVMKRLEDLHVVANDFFRQEDVCSAHAFSIWKGE